MKFFIDNNLSPTFAKILSELTSREYTNDKVIHLCEKVPRNVSDIEWIDTLTSEGGWIVISGDQEILRNKHERKAWKDSRLTGFFVSKTWMSLTFWDQAWRIVKWFPHIRRQSAMVRPGATFEIGPNANGKFKVLG